MGNIVMNTSPMEFGKLHWCVAVANN